MKKFGFLIALMALFIGVNTASAQPNLSGNEKVILVKVDPSTQAEARGKLLNVLTEGRLNGYVKAEQSYIVMIADDATKIEAAKNQILSVYPAAQLTVVTIQQANILLENQRNAAQPVGGTSH